MENYVNIGYTKKVFGVKGEIKIHIESQYLEFFTKADVAFLEIAGKQVPYFIESVRSEFPLVGKFEDVNSRETALDITGKTISMRAKDLIFEETNEIPISEDALHYSYCIGFEMKDVNLGSIGKISEVLAYPQQEMAVVNYQDKDVLIPLNEQLIVSIDEIKKQVQVDLPVGLLEL